MVQRMCTTKRQSASLARWLESDPTRVSVIMSSMTCSTSWRKLVQHSMTSGKQNGMATRSIWFIMKASISSCVDGQTLREGQYGGSREAEATERSGQARETNVLTKKSTHTQATYTHTTVDKEREREAEQQSDIDREEDSRQNHREAHDKRERTAKRH